MPRYVFFVLFVLAISVEGLLAEDRISGKPDSLNPCAENVISLESQKARTVRIVFHGKSDVMAVGIDELQIFGPECIDRNIALKQYGARAIASSSSDIASHADPGLVNDGVFGNDSTWIAAENDEEPWIEVTFPRISEVSKIVLSRDMTGQHADRFPQSVEVQICPWDGQDFVTVHGCRMTVSPAPRDLLSWDLPPVDIPFSTVPVPNAPDINTGLADRETAVQLPETWPNDEWGFANLALNPGAKANASSALKGYDIHKIANLNDGVLGNSASWIAEAEPAWAEIDLGDTYWIYRAALGSDSSGKHADRTPLDFSILVAKDYDADSSHPAWTKVVSVVNGEKNVRTRTEFLFEPVQARYLRVDTERANSSGVRIDELEVYGSKESFSAEKLAMISEKISPPPAASQKGSSQENTYDEFWQEAITLEELAWLKSYGRADYAPGAVNVPWYPENCKHPSHVPNDISTLPRATTAPVIDGRFSPHEWDSASSGTVRVAQHGSFEEGVYCECRVWAMLVDESLYGAVFANRLLTEHAAVLRTTDGTGILRLVRDRSNPAGKDKLVFQTVSSDGRIVSDKIDFAISGDGRRFEFRIPQELLPGIERGLCVRTGFGGRFTPNEGHPILFLPQPVAISQIGTVAGDEFTLCLTNTGNEPVRMVGKSRASCRENYTKGIDDPYAVDANSSNLMDEITLAAGEQRMVKFPAHHGPIGNELEIVFLIETVNKNNAVAENYKYARLNLFEYDPVGRTLDMARRLLDRFPNENTVSSAKAANFSSQLESLNSSRLAFVTDAQNTNRILSDSRELFLRARKLKRNMLFSLPGLDELQSVLFEKRYPLHPSHNYSDCVDNEWKTGGGIYVLDIPREEGTFQPSKATLRELYATTGMVRHPAPDFDLSKIYFTERLNMRDFWHIFEMNPDGSGLRQLTDGPFNDLYPTPLPDGDLAMISSRCKLKFLCWIPQALTLHRMDANGENIRRLSYANLTEFSPSVSRDGRILWTRSEYLDKGADYGHTLWYITPEGTAPELTFGNTVSHPQGYANGREVPGTSEVCSTLISHFGDLNGPITLIDIDQGRFSQKSITSITPEVPWPGVWLSYETFREAYPISTDFFLVSHAPADRFGLFLIDRYGNRELLTMDRSFGSFCPIPFRQREKPPVVPSAIDPDMAQTRTGVFQISNVYEGLGDTVEKDAVKYLRVCEEVPAPLTQNPDGSYRYVHEPFMEFYASPVDILTGPYGWTTYVAKADCGLVEIEEDGSVGFEAPAEKVLFFQLLDEDYNEIQRMRSVVQLQPGESRGCVGCHEDRAMATPGNRTIASTRTPQKLQAPPWGTDGFDYEEIVQPILDRNCVECHSPDNTASRFDLRGNQDVNRIPESYRTMIANGWVHHFNWQWQAGYPYKAAPYTFGTAKSRLWKVLEDEDHRDVSLTRDERYAVKCWTDLSCPLWPDYTQRSLRPHYPDGKTIQKTNP